MGKLKMRNIASLLLTLLLSLTLCTPALAAGSTLSLSTADELKTFAANTIRSNGDDEQTRADIARAFEDAVVDTLMIKCRRALEQTGFKRLVMAGGVSANRTLRAKLAEMMQKRGGEVFYARPEFCTDNGAMIAYAGMVRLQTGAKAELGVTVRPRWPLAELPAA